VVVLSAENHVALFSYDTRPHQQGNLTRRLIDVVLSDSTYSFPTDVVVSDAELFAQRVPPLATNISGVVVRHRALSMC
jgi:hypothetical protein